MKTYRNLGVREDYISPLYEEKIDDKLNNDSLVKVLKEHLLLIKEYIKNNDLDKFVNIEIGIDDLVSVKELFSKDDLRLLLICTYVVNCKVIDLIDIDIVEYIKDTCYDRSLYLYEDLFNYLNGVEE